jgi:hypothetical protein
VSPLHPAHTHAHTHTHTRARAHTRTRAPTPYPFSPSFSWFFFGRLCSPFSHACKATLLSSFHNLRCLAATPRCYAALRAFDDAGSLQLGEAVLPCQRRLTLCLSSPLYTGLAGALPCCIQAPHTRTRVAAHKSVMNKERHLRLPQLGEGPFDKHSIECWGATKRRERAAAAAAGGGRDQFL